MRETIRKLVQENNMCVLATCHDHRPHCSLMAYLTNERADGIYMVTRRHTQKYRNLTANPQVSLLIDTRTQVEPDQRSRIQALTISGTCSVTVDPKERDEILRQIVIRHPHLKELADHPDAAIISIQLHSFLLLDGALKAYSLTGGEMEG
ncbi:pyridoxamine 5'-phosphate oxidase family protein [Desulfoferrobacter suflitae]|uniref:pyridoxamine 5'-phosphate oxidase family protein n=1 Tax=Desulfoferrobacter suflitae TaxID=2865782 RepID=UPI002164D7CF|nr:pyridoxamine 5'-phosphate oxidase family protein [Desulfoferrobacter suflitae]MCK8601490.1 pyridoxamine 5'-phosphate oxidase family protein [Desulfoferrobacter suflitae]